MKTPRWYQQESVQAVFDYFERGEQGNPLVCLPTGTGKALCIAMLISQVMQQWPGQRVIMATDAQELVAQNTEEMRGYWPAVPMGVYAAGLCHKDARWPVTMGTIGSMWKRADLFGHIDLLIIDEAHMLSANDDAMYNVFIFELKKRNPYLRVIGFTATSYRLGMGTLLNGGIFTDIVYDITDREGINRLVAEGYMCKLIAQSTEAILSANGVGRRGGEFIESEAQRAVDVPELVDACVREIITVSYEENRDAVLVFAQGIEHIGHIVGCFNGYGMSAIGVHSKMGKGRSDALALHRSGGARVIVNNGILTKGYNDPRINLIGEMRLTNSPGLLVQMRGRGTRIYPNKTDCRVLDFAGNTKRCGPFNDPFIPKARGTAGGDAPVRICDGCGAYHHASVRVCDVCGFAFPREEKLSGHASSDAIMVATEAPKYEWFDVVTVAYTLHRKNNRPNSLRASYYCGLHKFEAYHHFDAEHEHPRHEARKWWRDRTNVTDDAPESVHEALSRTNEVPTPGRVLVWVNTRYKEIVGYD